MTLAATFMKEPQIQQYSTGLSPREQGNQEKGMTLEAAAGKWSTSNLSLLQSGRDKLLTSRRVPAAYFTSRPKYRCAPRSPSLQVLLQ